MIHEPVDDIIPPSSGGRRSIRNVSLSGSRSPRRSFADADQFIPPEPRKLWFPRFGLWIVAALALVFFGFALSFLFSGATISVTPVQREVSVSGEFTAERSPGPEGLPFQVMVLEETTGREIAATGREEASIRASGRIVIYNDFDSNSQRLITNTRFETPDGLIFRIDKPVIIPGRVVKNGVATPGSVEVEVFADEPGPKYNIGLTDFTIPGFKGSPRYEKFYARSKTPMQGGFVGTRAVVDPTLLEEARAAVREELAQKLSAAAESQIPTGFHLYDDGVFLSFESLALQEKNGKALLQEKAVLRGIIFNLRELASFVATQTIAGFDGSSVELLSPDDLSFSLSDRATLIPEEAESITFTLSGRTTIVSLFDEASLIEDLLGRSKNALPTILSGYPAIEKATAVIRPFWRQSFPDDRGKIKIERMLTEDGT